jgi:small subunit ribosomal protein S17
MSDDETKKDETVEDTPAQDEGAQSAGPAEESGGPAGGGEASVLGPPDSSPPAEEESAADAEETSAPEAEDEAPAAAEAEPDDAPAAEAEKASAAEQEAAPAAKEASEPDPGDDLPWKERRRLERSRRPNEAKPKATPEERAAARLLARKKKAAERRKERAAHKAKRTPGTGTPPAERDANAAKVRQGIVVSNKGDKSITVRIDIARRHPTYEKIVRRSRTLHAHDERNEAGEGDVVRVIETRPLSKTKRWRLVDVVEKAR